MSIQPSLRLRCTRSHIASEVRMLPAAQQVRALRAFFIRQNSSGDTPGKNERDCAAIIETARQLHLPLRQSSLFHEGSFGTNDLPQHVVRYLWLVRHGLFDPTVRFCSLGSTAGSP